MDIKARQKVFATMGAGACYQLSICDIAEEVLGRYVDAYQIFAWANQSEAIVEGKLMVIVDDTNFVNAPASILTHLTGRQWHWRKEGPDYACKPGEYEALRFEWIEQTTGQKIEHAHFVRGDGLAIAPGETGRNHVKMDPYGNSLTVKNGACVSKRIFWQE